MRAGRAEETGLLIELALRSKAHWGYDPWVVAAYREELRTKVEESGLQRVAVAERDGVVVGLVTLEGEPPGGELGMLFVEPAAIGTGVGRLLYRHALGEAGRLGFTRVLIASDPHAEGFYLAMGAERAGTDGVLIDLVAWPPGPEPSWVRAWTGGRGTVQIGNAAEFNGRLSGHGVTGGDHYSCLALFCSPRPTLAILPQPVEESWVRQVAGMLCWDDLEVCGGVAADGRMTEAILARADLLERIGTADSPVLPWGRTTGFDQIAPAPDGVLVAIVRYESKAGSHALFRALAPDHPGIVVPAQRPVGSSRVLARELARGPVVLKSEYGVGGSGTLVVPAGATGLRALARRWAREGVLLEEYVPGGGPYRNPTFDAVIDAAGEVHPVGVGLMDIEGVHYQGVTVGPGVLPDDLARTAARFGSAVGHVLAADGYRGWYDVDFVTGSGGMLSPTEINLRLTGPAVAFNLQVRLGALFGGCLFVRTLDHLPLGARLPVGPLREHLDRLTQECRKLGVTLVPTIPTAGFDLDPFLGVAIAARSCEALDRAEAAIRVANHALGEVFADLEAHSRGWLSRMRRARLPRS